MRRAYHGSTQGAMSLMGEPEGEEWKGAFRPLLPDVRAIDFKRFRPIATHHPPHGLRRGRTRAGRSGRTAPGSRMARSPAATLRRGGCAARLRRNSNRDGTHGRNVRHAQIRRHARHRLPGQSLRRRDASRSLRIAQRDHGHAANRPYPGAHHHLRRTSGLLRNGTGGPRISVGNRHGGTRRRQRRPLRIAAGGSSAGRGNPGAAACCWPSNWARRPRCSV